MKAFIRVTAFWATLGLIGAVLVVAFGLYNVSAQQGHWPGVSWVLHTTYRNAVKLRAPSEDAVPDLSSEEMIALGAGHYDDACRFCHAAPGERQSATATSMEPPPPPIADAVAHWEPRHLFWIVKNGVKMSGMPAWPSEKRGDDVWPVVAFLNAVEGMDGERYRELIERAEAPGDSAEAAPEQAAYCTTCHGRDDGERNRLVPRLDLLTPAYVDASLRAYRDGRRHSGMMQHAASDLEDGEIEALAAHVSRPVLGPAGDGADDDVAGLIERGKALAAGAGASRDMPACDACHGPWPSEREALFPSLAGQHRGYLLDQLDLWKAGLRGGAPLAAMMHEVVPTLEIDDMEALAVYYASLPATPTRRADAPASSD